ncbi:MAG: toprim domain-containing protein [Anaerolineae bacterium]|nr:toprim domain-containing protein [Anaerolineae bacterium]
MTNKIKGKKQAKVRWQVAGQKTDEPFYYVGTLEDLKREIARAGGKVYIVEGEFDVWSLHRLGIRNVIGIYGISNIPKDIGAILSEIGAASFVYLADNDSAGEKGGSNLRTLLHQSEWIGEGDYRKVAGAGIPHKGDANDLLCHYFPDISAARAALEALPRFEPRLKRKPATKPLAPLDSNEAGWEAVNEANRIAMGVTRFKANGFSENRSCPNKDHEDKTPSAALHKDGFCTCQVCGTFNSKQLAEFLGVDRRAILRAQRPIIPSKAVNLAAAPQAAELEPAPLSLQQAPDTWLRLFIKFYTKTVALLLLFVLRAQAASLLPKDFTRQELLKALRELGCNVSKESIYKVFQEVAKLDNHPLFVKVYPSQGSGSRYRKFRLRSAEDIKRRLAQGIGFRVYEKKFREHADILIGFKVFADALQ